MELSATRALRCSFHRRGLLTGVVFLILIRPRCLHEFSGATPVGTGTTQPDGSFTNVLIAENTSGPLLVEVGGGGTYAEDSQPATVVTLDVNDVLRTIIPAFTDGGATSGVVVSPATELVLHDYLTSESWVVSTGIPAAASAGAARATDRAREALDLLEHGPEVGRQPGVSALDASLIYGTSK